MNDEPNAVDWKPGDLVIHDADYKSWKMLMVVKRKLKDGRIWTRYLFAASMHPFPHPFPGTKTFKNKREFLHNPARFGIDVEDARQRSQVNFMSGDYNHPLEVTS